eukprot:Nk52_evm29s262 gene=Nk52_evmTU29s262
MTKISETATHNPMNPLPLSPSSATASINDAAMAAAGNFIASVKKCQKKDAVSISAGAWVPVVGGDQAAVMDEGVEQGPRRSGRLRKEQGVVRGKRGSGYWEVQEEGGRMCETQERSGEEMKDIMEEGEKQGKGRAGEGENALGRRGSEGKKPRGRKAAKYEEEGLPETTEPEVDLKRFKKYQHTLLNHPVYQSSRLTGTLQQNLIAYCIRKSGLERGRKNITAQEPIIQEAPQDEVEHATERDKNMDVDENRNIGVVNGTQRVEECEREVEGSFRLFMNQPPPIAGAIVQENSHQHDFVVHSDVSPNSSMMDAHNNSASSEKLFSPMFTYFNQSSSSSHHHHHHHHEHNHEHNERDTTTELDQSSVLNSTNLNETVLNTSDIAEEQLRELKLTPFVQEHQRDTIETMPNCAQSGKAFIKERLLNQSIEQQQSVATPNGDNLACLENWNEQRRGSTQTEEEQYLVGVAEEGFVVDESLDLENVSMDSYQLIRVLPRLDMSEESRDIVCLPMQTRNSPKMSLVLDLDETLVHCSAEHLENPDFIFPLELEGSVCPIHVKVRPYLEPFLRTLADKFEIIVFTASQKVYADELLTILDPERKWIKHRLFRDSCRDVCGNFIKDLTVLNRNLAHTIIVDNSPHAFAYQLDNGIPVESWFDDPEDCELLKLLPFLMGLTQHDDVRPVLRSVFELYKRVFEEDSSESSEE